MNKKYLIYGGIGVVVLIAIYYATKSPDQPITDEGDFSSEDESTSNTEITKEQRALDPKVKEVIKLKEAEDKKPYVKTIGKNVYTKVNNVKLRKKPYVNNGTINNIYGEVAKKDTLIGTIGFSVLDREGVINPSTNKVFNWFQIYMSTPVFDDIQKNQKNFLTRQIVKPIVFVREDVIKL
jgi:hypothetical protein